MCEWFPSEAIPIVDILVTFKEVKDTCFGWELGEGWESAITTYSNMFGELQQYAILDLGMEIRCTWKIHIIICHLQTFLSRVSHKYLIKHTYCIIQVQCGMARFAEQTGESIHARFKPVLRNHKRKAGHPEHGTRQQKAVVEFSSNNI